MQSIMENDETQANAQTSDLRFILTDSYTVSKRQLGILLLLLGAIAFLGLLALDFIGGGREGGIGPAQQAALGLSALVALVGASLIPLGDRPA